MGHDYRSYSEEIKLALIKGLISTGCFVEDIGLSLSPMVYFAQFNLNADAILDVGVMDSTYDQISKEISQDIINIDIKNIKNIFLNYITFQP